MIKQALKIFISLLMLIIAAYVLDWNSLKLALKKLDLTTFFFAIVISFAHFLVMAFRWHIIVSMIKSTPLIENIKHYLYATFLNSFTPSNLGGDIYRFCLMNYSVSNKASVFIALIRERIIGLLSYSIFYLVCLGGALVFSPSLLSKGDIFIVAGEFVFVGTCLIFLMPFILRKLKSLGQNRAKHWFSTAIPTLHEASHFESCKKFFNLLTLSLISLIFWIWVVKIVADDLELKLPVLVLGIIVILVEFIRIVPISIQGIGVREGLCAYFIGLLGGNPEAGFMLGTISYLALSLAMLFAGVVGWSLLQFNNFTKMISRE